MSVYESSITNPKKQLEFYKVLSEQLQQENQQLKGVIEEVREYIDEIIIFQDEDGEVYFKEEFETDYKKILQILDKVKENK